METIEPKNTVSYMKNSLAWIKRGKHCRKKYQWTWWHCDIYYISSRVNYGEQNGEKKLSEPQWPMWQIKQIRIWVSGISEWEESGGGGGGEQKIFE